MSTELIARSLETVFDIPIVRAFGGDGGKQFAKIFGTHFANQSDVIARSLNVSCKKAFAAISSGLLPPRQAETFFEKLKITAEKSASSALTHEFADAIRANYLLPFANDMAFTSDALESFAANAVECLRTLSNRKTLLDIDGSSKDPDWVRLISGPPQDDLAKQLANALDEISS